MGFLAFIGILFLFLFSGKEKEKELTDLGTVYDDGTAPKYPDPVPMPPPIIKPVVNPFEARPPEKYTWYSRLSGINIVLPKIDTTALDPLSVTGISTRDDIKEFNGYEII